MERDDIVEWNDADFPVGDMRMFFEGLWYLFSLTVSPMFAGIQIL